MNMNDKLKEAFDGIKAEEALKESAKNFLLQKTKGYTKVRPANRWRLIPLAACFLLIFLGGWLYFTPTVTISIDINPSVELGVNRFNQIISVTGYNEDGVKLADSLDVKYTHYGKAIRQIMENDDVLSFLSNGEIIDISVIGSADGQSSKILSEIEACTAEEENAYCHYTDSQEVDAAHEAGLSYGKYRAFLELQALDPSITTEKVQNMTMREIRDLINTLSPQEEDSTPGEKENSQQENGHGYGKGKRNGNGQGKSSDK